MSVNCPLAAVLGILAAMSLLRPARADIFVLENDGQVRGELINKDESPRTTYVIKTAVGVQVTLERDQVKQAIAQTPAQMDYDRIKPKAPDTADGQWKMAEWCREQKLSVERKTHLERVVALDPNHAEAHHALGHSQLNGRWVSPEQAKTEQGYVRYKGAWRTTQEVELMERDRKAELAQKDWIIKLKRWIGWFDSDKAKQARENIVSITDPYAVKALAGALAAEKSREIKQLYIDALANIAAPNAMEVLVHTVMNDSDDEVRLACIDVLVKQDYRPAVGWFIKGLKGKENYEVHRAATGLAAMKDPAAIGPLIDALVTTHTYKIDKGPPGQMSSTFGTGPGGGAPGFSFGGGGTETRKVTAANQPVLEALVQLSGGVNFNFDTKAWKYWYADQKKPASLNARRD